MKRKLLALLASVCMLALMLPVGIMPASAATYSGTCGDNLTWSLDTATGVLTIDGTGAMTNYTSSSSAPWYSYRSYITSVTIGNGVTGIGSSAFSYCDNLMNVTIGKDVKAIGIYAFSACGSLASVTVISDNPYFYSTGNCLIDATAKTPVLGWQDVMIPNGITYIDTFYSCTSLTGVAIPDSVTNIRSSAFSYCHSLSSISVSNGNPVYYSEGNCIIQKTNKSLIAGCKSSIIPTDVKSISYMAFRGQEFLNSITIPNSVTNIGYDAFVQCKNLTTVTIGNGVTSIGNDAFKYCDNLTKAYYLGSREQWSKVTVGENNTALTDHLIFLFDAPKHTIDDTIVTLDSFPGCEYSCDGVNWQASPVFDQLIPGSTYTFTRRLSATETSPASAPSKGVTVTLPKSTVPAPAAPTVASFTDTTVALTAVEGCVYKIGSGAWQTSPVFTGLLPATTYTFYQRYAGTDTAYASPTSTGTTQKTDKATIAPPAAATYSGTCGDNLTWSLDTATGVLTIDGEGAMEDYSRTSDAYLTTAPWGTYYSIIKSVIIGDSVTSIGDHAFRYFTSLTSVTIGNSVTSIGFEAFQYCSSLTSVTIPDSVNIIGMSAFARCKSLASVTIGNNVESIGDHAFRECMSLTSIMIPDSVTSIVRQAFFCCYKLIEVCNHSSLSISKGDSNYGYVGCYAKHIITDEKDSFLTTTADGYIFYEDGSVSYLMGYVGKETALTLPQASPSGKPYEIYQYAFYECESLTSVTIGNGVTSIGVRAFNCDSLTSVTIGNSVTSIGEYAFDSCTSLTSVTIPDSVTSIVMGAFYYCTSLTSVTIGNGVTSIGAYAFAHCNSLTKAYYLGTREQWSKVTVGGNNTNLTDYLLFQSDAPTYTTKNGVVTLDSFPGCEYSCDGVNWQASPVFDQLIPGSTYTFTRRLSATETSPAGTPSAGVKVTLPKSTVSAPAAPTVASFTDTTVTLTAVEGCEYKIGSGAWQTSPVFTGLSPATTYTFYQRYAETATTNASAASAGTTQTTMYTPSAPAAPTMASRTATSITLKAVSGCEYKLGDGDWQTSTTFTDLSPATEYTFCQRYAETTTKYASASSTGATFKTDKATVSAPVAPTVASFTDTTVTLTAVEGCEYKKGSGAWQTSPVFTGLLPATTYTFYQRYAETDTAYASPASIGTTQKTDKSANLSTPAAPTMASGTDTSITLKTIYGCEYKMDDGDWQASPTFTGLTVLSAHTFYQRYAETATTYASEPSEGVTLTVKYPLTAPADPVITEHTNYSVTLKTVTGCEYKMDDGDWQASPIFTDLIPGSQHTFYQRLAETDYTYASPASSLFFTVPKLTVAPPPTPVILTNTGSVVILQAVEGCEYSVDGGTWQSSPAIPGINEGENHVILMRYAETATTEASALAKVFIGTTSYGDADGNGKLDADDLTTIAKYVAKINTLGTVEYYAADVDNDGDLDADDLTKFSKYVAKIIPDLD